VVRPDVPPGLLSLLYLIGWQQDRCCLVYVIVVQLCGGALVDGLMRVDPDAVRPSWRHYGTAAWDGSS
jgi:hypothetical protein